MLDYGRAPSGQALVASDEARSDLHPSGFDPSRSEFTIADVLAWARTKPADEFYRYSEPNNCAVAQFVRHHGVSTHVDARWRLEHKLSLHILNTPLYPGVKRKFGDLVAALEKLCPDAPPSEWTHPDAYMNDVVVL